MKFRRNSLPSRSSQLADREDRNDRGSSAALIVGLCIASVCGAIAFVLFAIPTHVSPFVFIVVLGVGVVGFYGSLLLAAFRSSNRLAAVVVVIAFLAIAIFCSFGPEWIEGMA